MTSYDDIQKEVTSRDETDIEINIEFAYNDKKISEKEYLGLLCLIRIAKGLSDLATVSGNYANFIANKK
ncbi:hypothetical protein ES702_06992 [subsurface metagenome]